VSGWVSYIENCWGFICISRWALWSALAVSVNQGGNNLSWLDKEELEMWVSVGGDNACKPVIPCSSWMVSMVVNWQYGLGDWSAANMLSILAV
jgi:hypothetical protein